MTGMSWVGRRVLSAVVAVSLCALGVGLAAEARAAGDLSQLMAPDDTLGATVDHAEGLLFGTSERQVEFHGFINAEGYAFQEQAEHENSSFDLHNFYFAARAPISSDVALFAEVEYEHGATIRLDRCFLDWSIHPLLTLRVGRFYVPLSYERPHYWAPVRLMTSRPLVVDIPFHEWADTGVEIYGRGRRLGYDVSLVNGPFALTEEGVPVTDVRDNNDGKVPVLRLNAFPTASLELGAAYSRGAYDRNDSLHFELMAVDVRLHQGPLDVWAEFDRRTGDDEPGTPEDPGFDPLFTGDRAKKNGYYVLVAYSVIEGRPRINYLKPLIRFDRYETPAAGSEVRRLTVGLNWSPQPHFVIKTEYQWTEEVRGPRLDNDGFMGSFVADF